MIRFTIDGKLPTLNDYTNQNRTHWGAGAGMKKKATEKAAKACSDIEPIEGKVILHYNWHISTKHDLDNIAFGQKFIQDGLKLAGKIKDDSKKYVVGFTHDFTVVDKNMDKVIVTIESVDK